MSGPGKNFRHIVPVISGKGGVGKSTVAVNLALELVNQGASVALIDADFYGPSIPTMLGQAKLQIDHEERIIPPLRNGLKYISLGFFLENPDDAVIWRGPLFNKALHQMFEDVNWGQLDYCIVDMPPGTGDAQISLVQMLQLSGAIVVTTPQEVALADVRKAVNMLRKVNVNVLGIVENMSVYIAPDGSEHRVFGSGGGKALAEMTGSPLLAEIPLLPAIREGSDNGSPVAAGELSSENSAPFRELALKFIDILDKKSESQVKIIND